MFFIHCSWSPKTMKIVWFRQVFWLSPSTSPSRITSSGIRWCRYFQQYGKRLQQRALFRIFTGFPFHALSCNHDQSDSFVYLNSTCFCWNVNASFLFFLLYRSYSFQFFPAMCFLAFLAVFCPLFLSAKSFAFCLTANTAEKAAVWNADEH